MPRLLSACRPAIGRELSFLTPSSCSALCCTEHYRVLLNSFIHSSGPFCMLMLHLTLLPRFVTVTWTASQMLCLVATHCDRPVPFMPALHGSASNLTSLSKYLRQLPGDGSMAHLQLSGPRHHTLADVQGLCTWDQRRPLKCVWFSSSLSAPVLRHH
jgi:hypothetical protein